MILDESPIILTLKCNRSCIFCSRKKRDRIITLKKLKKVKEIPSYYYSSTITIEGGEPLLCTDIEEVIRFFKNKGIKDIMIMTNGYLLTYQKAQNLIEAGVSFFNINLPSHIESLFNFLTNTKGQFKKSIENIKKILQLTENVAITHVINKYNYKYLPKYLFYISKNFPNISYLSINFIKVLGKVKKNIKLVPRISEIQTHLLLSLKIAEKHGIKVIIDGIPLCFLKGFEKYSVDYMNATKSLNEKIKISICRNCINKNICSGIRKDYIKINGIDEFKINFENNINYLIK